MITTKFSMEDCKQVKKLFCLIMELCCDWKKDEKNMLWIWWIWT